MGFQWATRRACNVVSNKRVSHKSIERTEAYHDERKQRRNDSTTPAAYRAILRMAAMIATPINP
jgi:hypothetical protein